MQPHAIKEKVDTLHIKLLYVKNSINNCHRPEEGTGNIQVQEKAVTQDT